MLVVFFNAVKVESVPLKSNFFGRPRHCSQVGLDIHFAAMSTGVPRYSIRSNRYCAQSTPRRSSGSGGATALGQSSRYGEVLICPRRSALHCHDAADPLPIGIADLLVRHPHAVSRVDKQLNFRQFRRSRFDAESQHTGSKPSPYRIPRNDRPQLNACRVVHQHMLSAPPSHSADRGK